MSLPADVLGHHSESIDPTLWDWISHEIDEIVGLSPTTVVAAVGAFVVLMPLGLMALVAWRRRRMATRE